MFRFKSPKNEKWLSVFRLGHFLGLTFWISLPYVSFIFMIRQEIPLKTLLFKW